MVGIDQERDADVDVDSAKLARLRSMVAAILDELRSVPPEPAATERAAELARRTVVEVGSAVSDTELGELGLLIGDLDRGLSFGEARVLDAQLLGWLDGMAMGTALEAARATVGAERRQVRRLQAEASLEARRQARGVV